MSSQITIPISRLPRDSLERHEKLRSYFCDKDALATHVGNHWTLTLEWSDDPYRYVDPNLNQGLTWWGDNIRYKDIAFARKRRGRLLLSLNDTWTLESWSEWLVSNPQHPHITVLHVDDHKDLGPPRIFQHEDAWVDSITGKTFNLLDPCSVTSAIKSGALGMGSFLTPFLHFAPSTDVRHLCQGPKCIGTIDSAIKLDLLPDTLLNPNKCRPGISLTADNNGIGRGRYRFTNDFDSWLEGLNSDFDEETAILLHIDMDYFCNRYDGDSDAIENPGPLDCSLQQVLIRINELTQALKRHKILDRLADIVVAFSPGFFPAEFWAQSCNQLLIGLEETI